MEVLRRHGTLHLRTMPIPPRRTPLLRTVFAMSLLLVAAVAGVLLFLRVDRVVVASGRLVGGSRAVCSPADALVAEVLVRPDQRVQQGEALLVLESAAVRSERRRTEVQIEALESRLGALEARERHLSGVRHPRARREAELGLERARLEQESSERQLAALATLTDEGLVDRVTLDQARLRHELARVALGEATLLVESLGAEQDAELETLGADLRQAQGLLEEQRLAAAELARQEALSTVVSPAAGLIVGADLERLVGRRVLAGEELLRVADGRAERFVGELADAARPHVQRAMAVRLRVDGYPWLIHGSLRGSVSSVGESASEGAKYPVEVALEGGTPLALYEGMRADARILVEERVRVGELLFERLVER